MTLVLGCFFVILAILLALAGAGNHVYAWKVRAAESLFMSSSSVLAHQSKIATLEYLWGSPELVSREFVAKVVLPVMRS